MPEKHSPYKYFLCGGLGRLFSVGFGYPLDTIKVRLQTMPLPNPGELPLYTGMIDCIRKTIQSDGYKGLYRGMLAPLVVSVPVNAIIFLGFSIGKKLIEKDVDHIHSMPELFAAGAFSGTCASVFVGPAERIKCLLQSHHTNGPNSEYKSTVDCFKKLYTKGGIRHIYKGTVATILRDIPATGVFFMSYESLKKVIVSEDTSTTYNMVATIIAGGLAGMCYWVIAMPADLLKTRLQTAPDGTYNGLKDVFKKVLATEGPRGFYSGLTPVIIRAFPVNAATFLGFEVGLKVYDWIIPDI